jgi:hypothetical protein
MNHYFLVDNAGANLTQIRTECFTEHALATNNQNVLSEVVSFDGAERLIKVDTVTPDWVASRGWLAEALWHAPQGQGDEVRIAWAQAQDPTFDGDEDAQPDSPEQRRSWWQGLL